MRSFLKFFSSVKLAIVLFILITLASILGTLIPQGRSPAEYAARYGGLAGVFTALQLTRLYSSAWYLVLLLLFALNTTVCTVTRFGLKWKRAFGPAVPTDAPALQAARIKGRFRLTAPLEKAEERVRERLLSGGYRVAEAASPASVTLLARKKRLGRFGSDVVHLGLLVILAGGLTSALAGKRSSIALREGDSAEVPGAAFSVRLDRFDTEYYPQGVVKDWKSTVTVVERGTPVLTRVVEVNHPLTYRGFALYQSGYGPDWQRPTVEIEVRKRDDASFLRTITLRVGEKVPFEDANVSHVSVRQFVPDFVIGEGNRVLSRSSEPNNPAALVEAWKGESRVQMGWVFAKYPDFGQGHAEGRSPYLFVLKRYQAESYSVLEAAKDPGAGFIWVGSALVIAGLFLAFYWHPREIRVVLEEAQGKVEAAAAGEAPKGRDAFQAEFDRIFDDMRKTP
jgi:cytochrome c biogenesis protein